MHKKLTGTERSTTSRLNDTSSIVSATSDAPASKKWSVSSNEIFHEPFFRLVKGDLTGKMVQLIESKIAERKVLISMSNYVSAGVDS